MTTLMFNEISYTTKGTSKVRCLLSYKYVLCPESEQEDQEGIAYDATDDADGEASLGHIELWDDAGR